MDDKFEELSIEDIINILIKRKALIALVTLGFLVLGLVQTFVLTKPRYASNVAIEINDIEDMAITPPTEGSTRVYNFLENITGSTNMKFEDYVKELTSDPVLEKTIKDLKLEDTYSPASLKSAIGVSSDPEAKSIQLKVIVKDSKLGSEILVKLAENFKEHITTVSQENLTSILEIVEEQMEIEKEKYSEALEEYKEATAGTKTALELELELEAIYEQITEYKLSLNDLAIKKDGINGALKKGPSSQGGGMMLRPNIESGSIYIDSGKGTLEIDLAETEARTASTKETIKRLQEEIQKLKIEYQEVEFVESAIRQKVELTKESYEIFVMKHQEVEMKSSMDIGGISINVLSETITENQAIGTRKIIKIAILTILGFILSIILAFVLEYIQYRKKNKAKGK